MNSKSLFIATPISAFSSDEEYKTFRKWLTALTDEITERGAFAEVFCVACIVKSQSSLDDPADSLMADIAELDRASHFLFVYPVSTPTSALIELGYALAKKKVITITHPKNIPLPFMATKLDIAYDNVSKVEFSEFNKDSILEVLSVLNTDDMTTP